MKKSLFLAFAAFLAFSAAASAYVIKLKDGSLIFARTKYTVKGDRAIITLENGTVTALKLEEIDVEGSEKYNKENFGNVVAIDTPDSRKPTPAPEAPQPPRIQDYIKQNKPRMDLPPSASSESGGLGHRAVIRDASIPISRRLSPGSSTARASRSTSSRTFAARRASSSRRTPKRPSSTRSTPPPGLCPTRRAAAPRSRSPWFSRRRPANPPAGSRCRPSRRACS